MSEPVFGVTVHIPGFDPEWAAARPACGDLGIMSLEIYPLSLVGDPIVSEDRDSIPTSQAFHPHVTCDACGEAMIEYPDRGHSTIGLRWTLWLAGDRATDSDDGCTYMVRVGNWGQA